MSCGSAISIANPLSPGGFRFFPFLGEKPSSALLRASKRRRLTCALDAVPRKMMPARRDIAAATWRVMAAHGDEGRKVGGGEKKKRKSESTVERRQATTLTETTRRFFRALELLPRSPMKYFPSLAHFHFTLTPGSVFLSFFCLGRGAVSVPPHPLPYTHPPTRRLFRRPLGL